MKKTTLILILLILAAIFPVKGYAQAETQDEILKKLDELLTGQKQVLARLEEMKQELYIIKIRATKR